MKNQKIDTIELNIQQYRTIISALVSYANNCAANRTEIYGKFGECTAYESWGHQLNMADDIAFRLEKHGSLWELDEADIVEVKPLSNYDGALPPSKEIREQVEERMNDYSGDTCINLDLVDFGDGGNSTNALYAAHALGMYDAMRLLANWLDGINRAPY